MSFRFIQLLKAGVLVVFACYIAASAQTKTSIPLASPSTSPVVNMLGDADTTVVRPNPQADPVGSETVNLEQMLEKSSDGESRLLHPEKVPKSFTLDSIPFDIKRISIAPIFPVPARDLRFRPLPEAPTARQNGKAEGFQWRPAIGQSLMFLAVQHGYAMTQPKTREAMKGKFWKDYVQSVKNLHGWDDGGRFFTNYVAHPLQGSFSGFIYVQNDPKARRQQFGSSGDYWRGRLKAMAWSAAWSTQFELGPISQASIGNVGLKGKQTWGDIVVTPTVGTAMLVGEDAIDRFVMRRLERASNNLYIKIFVRMLLNPTRNFANLLRFKPPWYRDRPRG